MKSTNKLFILICLLIIFAKLGISRCRLFDLYKSIHEIPYIIHGKVYQSNFNTDCIVQMVTSNDCYHEFKIEIVEVLKGKILVDSLYFKYKYRSQHPTISIFQSNQEFIFFIREISDDNLGKIYGSACGLDGAPIEMLNNIKIAIKKLESSKSDENQQANNGSAYPMGQ